MAQVRLDDEAASGARFQARGTNRLLNQVVNITASLTTLGPTTNVQSSQYSLSTPIPQGTAVTSAQYGSRPPSPDLQLSAPSLQPPALILQRIQGRYQIGSSPEQPFTAIQK